MRRDAVGRTVLRGIPTYLPTYRTAIVGLPHPTGGVLPQPLKGTEDLMASEPDYKARRARWRPNLPLYVLLLRAEPPTRGRRGGHAAAPRINRADASHARRTTYGTPSGACGPLAAPHRSAHSGWAARSCCSARPDTLLRVGRHARAE
jgi:hypothetical protein